MKRYVLAHVPMALGYGVVVFLVNAGWHNPLAWGYWILGVVLGALVLFVDRIVYTYSYLGAEISKQFHWLVQEKRYGEALAYLDTHRLEQERLAFRSVLFMVVWVPLAFFALTSTAGLFGKGVVMGLMLHILADSWRLQRSEPRRLHVRLFWLIKREVSDEERTVFLSIVTGVFVLLSFWVG